MSICVSRHGEYSEHGEYDPDNDYICTRCFTFDEDAALTELHRLRREAQPTPVCDHEALLRTIIRTSDQTGTSAATLIQAAEAMLPAPAGVIDREALIRIGEVAVETLDTELDGDDSDEEIHARIGLAVLAVLHTRTVAQVKAEALREAAQTVDWEWETFRAGDGMPSIRMHGKTPSELLNARADELEREDKR